MTPRARRPLPAGVDLACDPARLDAAETAVIVPARDEAELIGRCLAALAPQLSAAAVIVAVNNTSDDTAARALALARREGLPLAVAERRLPRGGVGAARRFGFALAARLCPQAEALLTTDADAAAAPDWIDRMRAALAGADVAAGRIETFPDEARGLPPDYRRRQRREERYLGLSLAFEALMDPAGRAGGLNLAGGANLGVRAAAYRQVGGFRRRESNEDRDLVDRLRAAGLRVARPADAVVRASLRPVGRAPAGMAANVAARLAGRDAADSSLHPLDVMLARHLRPDLHLAALAARRRHGPLDDLPALRACVARLGACATLDERFAVARSVLDRRMRATRRAPAAPDDRARALSP
ncbi:glycosyltransferase family 2 protein [Albimonas sp. CAU 1670]|uniref:glycosyltransferase n=1 Tax=Albimonas sp. CAU 1670 TaxID=3032599 RepID=UPI0023DC0F43|nr:glycosyltransferase family 2 protein [Albimonas sp. CAU 1670]MDF2231288.1 glycosyltransferase family 2 protein [Albimonas sp. CAU 1670]